jgi:iron complex outermembrane receptor protein
LNLNQDNFSWRGAISWKPDPDALFYASLTRGYKAGSFTVPAAVFSTQFEPVTQESVLAYEAGAKLGLLDRKVQITSAIFYYDYTNKQLSGSVLNPFFGSLSQLINIPKSRVYGAELELLVTPVRGLRLSAGATYLNSRVQEDPRPPAQALDPLGRVNTFVGESFSNTPKWLLVGDAEYDFAVRSYVDMFVGGNISYRSHTSAAFGDGPEFVINGYGLLDLRAGFEARDGKWRVQFYGRNVTNKYYWTGVPRNLDTIVRFAGTPATYGVQLSFLTIGSWRPARRLHVAPMARACWAS